MNRKDCLFADAHLSDVMRQCEQKMLQEIDEFEGNYLLNTSIEDLGEYLENKYKFEPPVLKEDETYIANNGETDVDVRYDPSRWIDDKSKPFYIKGTFAEFAVPFLGDHGLFRFRPSQGYMNTTYGVIKGSEVRLNYTRTDHNGEAMRADFDRNIKMIAEYLGWITNDVAPFNSSLRDKARQRVEWRREKLLKDQGMTSALGFPLKQRPGAPTTYIAPVVRQKLPIQKPVATKEPYKLEPQLEMKEYDHILSIISNMVQVMERSPHAFSKMGEEDLRQHFLVQLNGQYEGQVTGETFNYEGKTDILIRVDGRNIFIAECKFWKGTGVYLDTIDQILGYLSWRDTKTAIILFNRNKDFSAVLSKIPGATKSHANFKRELDWSSETGFRYIFHQRDDKNREVILTVIAFDVPE
ncbi:MAG: hypothetical protein PHI31_12125 [Desulfuromonadaceae bacterium]|nr:hypothetical protein [Desulfuromonadaceae bacterium]